MSESFQSTQINTLWSLIELHGHDPAPIFAEEGIDLVGTTNPEHRLPHSRVDRLWKNAQKVIKDPCFGLDSGRVWHPSHSHALGYAWLATSSLREGLEYLHRYKTVMSERNRSRIEYDENEVRVILADPKKIPAQIDSTMSIFIKLCRLNYGESLKPLRVEIRHEERCRSRYEDLFQTEILFGADSDRIVLGLDDVNRRLETGNALLLELHEGIVKRQLSRIGEDSSVGKVRTVIKQLLPSGDVSAAEVAKVMNTSLRSFQRMLGKADMTYSDILKTTRLDLVDKYLKDPHLSLTEIAFLLGYSDYSSFSRAYKNWTGKAPRGKK